MDTQQKKQVEWDPQDVAAIIRTNVARQAHIKLPTIDSARIALICKIQELWPMSAKKRQLRLSIIMALLGKPITTQNELCGIETRFLLEALNDNDFRGSCWERLQASVEGQYFAEPWTYPATAVS